MPHLDKDQFSKAEVQELLRKQSEETQDRITAAEMIAEMSSDERNHYDSLGKSAKEEFLFASSSERGTLIEKALEADPVMYKALDGTEIRKSDGIKMAKMAKDNDENLRKVAALEEAADTTRIEKFVNGNLSHLAGEDEVKVAIVKAVEGIEDEEVRKSALETLKAQDAGVAKAFETAGVHLVDSRDFGKNDDSAEAELDRLTKKYVESNPEVSFYDAYDLVATAHPELYTKAVNGQ